MNRSKSLSKTYLKVDWLKKAAVLQFLFTQNPLALGLQLLLNLPSQFLQQISLTFPVYKPEYYLRTLDNVRYKIELTKAVSQRENRRPT